MVDHGGNLKFRLGIVVVFLQEVFEHIVQTIEEIRSESPEIHGNHGVFLQLGDGAVIIHIADTFGGAADFGHLGDGGQLAVLIGEANAT